MLLVLKILWVLSLCLVTRAYPEPEGCAKCEEEYCPKTGEECQHGLVQDPCGCCPNGVCLLIEREKCFNGDYTVRISESGLRKYGTCGEYMECVTRADLRPNEYPESLCLCKHTDPVCGSDNNTYGSLCEMRIGKVELSHYGPCTTKPIIVSGPEVNSKTYEGSTFALDCEAKGFPVPSISWEFQSSTGLMVNLPGDDSMIIVHSRGGPENYMLTSWLQIESLRRNDSGRYICVAKNSEGEDRAMAMVYVSVYSV